MPQILSLGSVHSTAQPNSSLPSSRSIGLPSCVSRRSATYDEVFDPSVKWRQSIRTELQVPIESATESNNPLLTRCWLRLAANLRLTAKAQRTRR